MSSDVYGLKVAYVADSPEQAEAIANSIEESLNELHFTAQIISLEPVINPLLTAEGADLQ